MAHLDFYLEDRLLFRHLLHGGRTMIGRADTCDVALPSDTVSRIHGLVEEREGEWLFFDRSRHGTLINGEKNPSATLQEGDHIQIGEYDAIFSTKKQFSTGDTTITMAPIPAATHEEIVEVHAQHVAHIQGVLTWTPPISQERKILLDKSRITVGGKECDIVIHPEKRGKMMTLRVVRGRVMVEPHHPAIFLTGLRIRELTPVFHGEDLRLEDHVFTVHMQTVEEPSKRMTMFGAMVGESDVMQHLFGILRRIAAHDHPVLVQGESGTGKELVAEAIHTSGNRRDAPFVALNCAAIPDNLFESELFGHVKGAFTGADRDQKGAFQRAEGGTLFLDEIGEVKIEMQAKLLRALESGEVRRVGSNKVEFPDVRVIAATNRDLQNLVKQGLFREDLYFRLAVLTASLPPLRDRGEDIPLLARTLLQRHHPDATLTSTAIQKLKSHTWPGNVRELRNVLTRAYVLGGAQIDEAHIVFYNWSFKDAEPELSLPDREAEKIAIMQALEQHQGNRTYAARALGIPRTSFIYKMKKWGID